MVVSLDMRVIAEAQPGAALQDVFSEYWPAYRKWMARSKTTDMDLCVHMLRTHMPELLPVFDRLRSWFDGDPAVARFLTLYNPPRMVRGCSQLVREGEQGPELLHTYDHHPDLFDGVVLESAWSGRGTLVVTDCLWGALDGINGAGLTVALAFGGRRQMGDGFAAPLVVRYLLETCDTVSEARMALRRLPVFMSYTFAVLDAVGDFCTAFLAPDRDARFVERRASTNHQGTVEWPEYARHVHSVDRLRRLESLLEDSTDAETQQQFLSPPIWRTEYARGSGTLYASRYAPSERRMDLLWPTKQRSYRIGESCTDQFSVTLPKPGRPEAQTG